MRARVTAAALALTTGAALLIITQATADESAGPSSWCTRQGGSPGAYRAYYDNGARLTPLGTIRDLCHFRAKDGSRIVLPTDTLAADAPTLASLAYKRKPPLPAHPVGNPSAAYCAKLGGTTQFGEGKPDVGGWIRKGDPVDRGHLHNMCMFADGSAIDAWGLTYHTGGVIRGADLENKFRAHIPPAVK
ncbi:hypothetical protein I5Q34_24785 [Streptomyces sp. AV19]|uniref:hypothetical protein n=1 Tax=Streptomyces sp. AV19 TaxID=2793068 RepID=UPI0018FE0BB0|nr:hypothetical protein [Streptomyces sp. AV19]MBH1937446.1 hypothetical protein [Streptomyces sp. AV19]MDG4533781.1 DUF333 domain-containing protein [Streptomyces sp. AV19]